MKRSLVLVDALLPRMVVCDISSKESRPAGYLRMFSLLDGVGAFKAPDLMEQVESILYKQAVNGHARAAMAFLLLNQRDDLTEVDVEEVPLSKVVKVVVPEALNDENLPPRASASISR